MASENDFSLGTKVSFDVYPEALLGTKFNHVKVLGILDADTARGLIDPDAMHANVYPTLPDGVPDDPTGYYYIKVALPGGQQTAVGLPWIKGDTITVHDSVVHQVTIEGSNEQSIRSALSANGINSFSIKTM